MTAHVRKWGVLPKWELRREHNANAMEHKILGHHVLRQTHLVPLTQDGLTGPGQAISVSFESAASPSAESNGYGYCSSGNFSMRLSPEQARVTTKTRGIISPLGEIIAHNVSFDPVVFFPSFWHIFLVILLFVPLV
jgi:hypothetical protein